MYLGFSHCGYIIIMHNTVGFFPSNAFLYFILVTVGLALYYPIPPKGLSILLVINFVVNVINVYITFYSSIMTWHMAPHMYMYTD